ncbi:MAG: trypsin-like serine peptidase [Aristaeellaceae bacterium]
MNRFRALLLMLLAVLLALPCPGLAEDAALGVAAPAMDMSLEEAAALGLTPELPAEAIACAPFQPDTLDRLVVGADNRTAVSAPSTYPYSAIAYMKVQARCGCQWTGSGFMVSKDCLMTAAHCVACVEHGETANRITLYFGYRSDKNYLIKYDGATTYWYGTDFRSESGDYHTAWDYAYVQLEKNVGDTTGWFGLNALSDETLDNAAFEVAGYRNGSLKTSQGVLSVYSDQIVHHSGDTEPGYSGCPVFNGDYYVVAINVAQNKTRQRNIARRITWDLVNEMRDKGMFD